MKKTLTMLVATILALGLWACSGGGSDKGGAGMTIFTDAAKQSLPNFSGTRATRFVSDPWTWGQPIFEFYSMFTEDNPGAYFNLYDALDWADGRFSDAMSSGSDITAQEVSAPWEVGFNSGDASLRTYNRLHTYTSDGYLSKTYARKDGAMYYMLCWTEIDRWDTGGEKSKSITQAVYDESTGDLKLGMFMANFVDEVPPGSWELVRAYAEGNTGTNLFTLKIIRDGYGYDHNVIGRGKARGAGNYFLLKLMNGSMAAPTTFYTFPAEATIAELQDMANNDAHDTTPQNDTQNYAADLPVAFDSSVLPTQGEAEDLTAP